MAETIIVLTKLRLKMSSISQTWVCIKNHMQSLLKHRLLDQFLNPFGLEMSVGIFIQVPSDTNTDAAELVNKPWGQLL